VPRLAMIVLSSGMIVPGALACKCLRFSGLALS